MSRVTTNALLVATRADASQGKKDEPSPPAPTPPAVIYLGQAACVSDVFINIIRFVMPLYHIHFSTT